jgi:hypothetical protein
VQKERAVKSASGQTTVGIDPTVQEKQTEKGRSSLDHRPWRRSPAWRMLLSI